jgi:FkbM family methyltransferase
MQLTEDYVEVPLDASAVEFVRPSATPADWPIAIETPSEPWSYAAYLRIPRAARRLERAFVRIRTTNVRGEPWVGILTRDQKDFLCRVAVPEGPELRETLLGGVDLRTASRIVVENGAERGSSVLTIEHASLLIPPDLQHLLEEAKESEAAERVDIDLSLLPSKDIKLDKYRFSLRGLSEGDPYFDSLRNNFEPEFQAFCRRFIPEDAVCVDIGANIGVKTLFLSRHAQKGRVVAIEAAPGVAACLRENIAANRASNVECVEAAIGDRIGRARFTESSAYGHISKDGVEIPMLTLPEVVRRLALQKLDFIKIDVEGFEYNILRSAYETINAFRSLVLLEFNSWCQIAFADTNPREFLTWLFDRFSYVGILRRERGGRIEEVRKDQLLYVLHDNLVVNHCLTDFLVTNARERL